MSTSKVNLALMLMMDAHNGQVDKAGEPYYKHPISVSRRMEDEDSTIVAYLHDTVEDTYVTLDLIRELFGNNIADAVDHMTHREGEDYFDYINRVKENPISVKVKKADLLHNMNLSRLKEVTGKDLQRIEKYKKAYEILTK